MSNLTVPEAKLEGYAGPFFPDSLSRIHESYYLRPRVRGLTRPVIRNLCREAEIDSNVEGYPKTSDGYEWFCKVIIRLGDAEVALMLPWAGDRDPTHTTESDRWSSVYTRGKIDQSTIESAIDPFIIKLEAWTKVRRK